MRDSNKSSQQLKLNDESMTHDKPDHFIFRLIIYNLNDKLSIHISVVIYENESH